MLQRVQIKLQLIKTTFNLVLHEYRKYRRIKKRFPEFTSKVPKSKKEILVESNQIDSSQLALALIIPILSERLNASIKLLRIQKGGWLRKYLIKFRNSLSINRIYGAKRTLVINSRGNNRCFLIAKKLMKSNNNPKSFEQIMYLDIRIGDLVYDTYLSRYNLATLNFNDENLIFILAECIEYVESLDCYFSKNRVAAVCVSHTVYLVALPVRVALKYKIPAFQVNSNGVYRLSSEYLHSYTDTDNYPDEFRKLPSEIQSSGLIASKKQLNKRFDGIIGVDMHYSTKSAYHNFDKEFEVIKQTKRRKILIAAHDFYDSPHAFGDHLYPDFFIWLETLFKIAKNSNCDWYIKTHPDLLGEGEMIIEKLIRKYQSVQYIPKEVSHHTLLNQGISIALTVCGTIGMEYPSLGRFVINASINNPHSAYNFSVTPKNREEYEVILKNLENVVYKIDENEILEYYFMHNIYRLRSWIFKDYEIFLNEVGGYYESNTEKVFNYYFTTSNRYSNSLINQALVNFLNSEDICLKRQHFDKDLKELKIALNHY